MTRPSRRRFLRGGLALAGLGLVSGCGLPASPAPQPPKQVKLGLLSSYSLDPSPESAALRQALREHGYVEGQNLTLLPRYGSGSEAIAARAAELAGLGLDAILTVGDGAARAAKQATATIPIVTTDAGDPVADGLVASLGRPGGNATGLTTLAPALRAKRLELLKTVAPALSHVKVVWVSNTDDAPEMRELSGAAATLGVQLSFASVRGSADLTSPFSDAITGPVDGLLVLTSAYGRSTQGYSGKLAEFAASRRLPAIYEGRSFVEGGGLMAYGPNFPDLFRRAAGYVDRIVKGARPADLPVEQPTLFDLVVNLGAARALGLSIPDSVLQQATEVIQ